LVLLSLVLLFVWHQTILSEEADRTAWVLFSIGCSVGYILLCIVSIRAGVALDGKYSIDDHSIQATSGRTKITVRMDRPLYMTKMTIVFHIRYGKLKYSYLGVSSNPIDGIIQEYAGIPAIAKAMKANVVMIPWDESIQDWVKERWSKDVVSDFPKVMYFPGRDSGAVTEI